MSKARLTQWFPPTVQPTRNGVYLTRPAEMRLYKGVLRYWNGSCWSFMDKHSEPAPFLSEREWRGLARAPK